MLTDYARLLTVALAEWDLSDTDDHRRLELHLPLPLVMPDPPGSDHHFLVCSPLGPYRLMLAPNCVHHGQQHSVHPYFGWSADTRTFLLRIFLKQMDLDPERAPLPLHVARQHIIVPFRTDSLIMHHEPRLIAFRDYVELSMMQLLYPGRGFTTRHSVN